MRRTSLQALTLAIWIAGALSCEVIVVFADRLHVDSYQLSEDGMMKFQNYLGSQPMAPELQKSVLATVNADRPLNLPTTGAEVRAHFAELLRGTTTLAGLNDSDQKKATSFLTTAAAQGKLSSYYFKMAEIYIPWLLAMIGGIFAFAAANETLDPMRATVSLSLSILLQAVFVAVLWRTLYVGTDIAKAEDGLHTTAVALTAVVGCLVQFGFPKAPSGRGAATPSPTRMPAGPD